MDCGHEASIVMQLATAVRYYTNNTCNLVRFPAFQSVCLTIVNNYFLILVHEQFILMISKIKEHN